MADAFGCAVDNLADIQPFKGMIEIQKQKENEVKNENHNNN